MRRLQLALEEGVLEGDAGLVHEQLQGIQTALPELDIFLDVLKLRSGKDWKKQLEEEIPRRDVFYLFWSQAASRSPWVKWEWNLALSRRGLDYIQPVPMVSPREVPPPPELAGLHFKDWTLALMGNR